MTGSLKALVAMFALVAIVGCNSPTTKPTSNGSIARNDVTDVRPVSASQTNAYSSAGGYQTAPLAAIQPVTYDAAPTAVTSTPDAVGTAKTASYTIPAGNGKHVVRKGETLYSIARASYGDGKKWQKIAAANPGLNAGSLKVGQTIIVP